MGRGESGPARGRGTKKPGTKPVQVKIEVPLVSAKDLENAKIFLANEEELKRQRSSMIYALKQSGTLQAYKDQPLAWCKAYVDPLP